jgi:lauroyl/myristoyl acyltransferase
MTADHTQRWAYRKLYTPEIFALTTRLYPWARRPGFQAVSRSVAWLYAVTQPGVRAVVRANLALLRPEPVPDAEAVRVFVNYGAAIADYVAVGAMPREKALALCAETAGMEHLAAATAGGRGAILATGHYSFFEFGSIVLGAAGYRVTIATLPEPTGELTQWRSAWRERWGTQTVPVGDDPFSSLHVIRAIESGHCMAMLADRPMAETALPVDLPNGRMPFSTSPALLAWMTGRPILPVVVRRLRGGRYRVTACPPVTVDRRSGLGRDGEIARCTTELAGALISEIQNDPRQWFQFVPVGLPAADPQKKGGPVGPPS